MEIKRIVVGPLRTNSYILTSGSETVIIDPGGDHDVIINYIEMEGLVPKMILATHGHFDHILSVSQIKSRYRIPFAISIREGKIIETFEQYSKMYAGLDPGPAPVPDLLFNGGESFQLGDKVLEVVETPGHTPGSCSFILDNSIFTGDFIFKGSIGRTDFGGSYRAMTASLRWAKEQGRNFDIYPGHGEFTTLEEEKKTNPFFNQLLK